MAGENTNYDVIVVGAGPCGSTAAFEVAKAGHRVLLLEKDAVPGEFNSCGGGLGAFLQKKFDLPNHLIHKRINTVDLNLGRERTVYRADRPIYMSVKRTEFDRYLAERAVSVGAELKVRHVAQAYDPLRRELAVLNRATKAVTKYAAPLVIFADGARTLAWSQCGIGVNPDVAPIVGLAWELSYPDNPHDRFEFFFDEATLPYGYFWVFPTTDTLNVGIGGPVEGLGRQYKELLQAFIDSRDDLRGRPAVRKTAGLIPSYVAGTLHAAGVMAVGDAGGFVNPLTGGGIYLGMVSAQMAARVANEALSAQRFDAAFLSRYTRRVKLSPFYAGLKVFHGLVTYSQNRLKRTGRPVLGKIFKVYSDIGDFALRRL